MSGQAQYPVNYGGPSHAIRCLGGNDDCRPICRMQRAAVVERQCLANVPTKLGLTLQEGRAILTGIEQEVVQS
jgi:hypothetical protein